MCTCALRPTRSSERLGGPASPPCSRVRARTHRPSSGISDTGPTPWAIMNEDDKVGSCQGRAAVQTRCRVPCPQDEGYNRRERVDGLQYFWSECCLRDWTGYTCANGRRSARHDDGRQSRPPLLRPESPLRGRPRSDRPRQVSLRPTAAVRARH